MNNSVFIDISGLNYKHQSGVQNTLHGLINGYLQTEDKIGKDFVFYDASGKFNLSIHQKIGSSYSNKLFSKHLFAQLCISKLYDLEILRVKPNTKIESNSNNLNHVWNWGIKKIKGFDNSITMFDLLPIEFPTIFSSKMIDLTEKCVRFAENECIQVQAISKHTKKIMLEYSNLKDDQIDVVYPGINEQYFNHLDLDENGLKEYDLVKFEYFISIGYLDPRKNLINQIKAFILFKKKTKNNIKYALTGFKGSYSNEITDLLNDKYIKNYVIFLGFVELPKLKTLLHYSAGLLYASLSEGFGLPIIEAYAMKTNVVTSQTTSMVEIGTNKAFMVDPTNIESIMEGINQAYDSRDAELIESNFQFATNFTEANWFKGHFSKELYCLPV